MLLRTIFISAAFAVISTLSFYFMEVDHFGSVGGFSLVEILYFSAASLFIVALLLVRMSEADWERWKRINKVFQVFPGMLTFGLVGALSFAGLECMVDAEHEIYIGLVGLHSVWAIVGGCGIGLERWIDSRKT